MARLTPETVKHLARLQGLTLDDERAETIAERLSAVLDDLDSVPDELLVGIEPITIFIPPSVSRDE
ncbi:MAG: hypothetical protein O2854_10270 [Chloroflexi bacterium]|nr:hypothetical protein [Chloroflexota bacterium]